MSGYFKTALLLAGLTAVFMALGHLVGGQQGMLIALVFAGGMNFFAYWFSDRVALAAYGAQPVTRQDAPVLVDTVTQLAQRAGLPMPRVYIIDSPQPNAFATGRNPENAAVAFSTALLRNLTHDEVAGVIAHELAHIKNRDTLIMTITATLAGALSMIANFAMFMGHNRESNNSNPLGAIGGILVMILAPLGAMLVQSAISRSREYEADSVGAEITGNPNALASALINLHNGARQIPNEAAERNPATAHLFIVNPLNGRGADNLFSTHPSTENRVRRLREMCGDALPATGSQDDPSGPTGHLPGAVPQRRRRPWN